jgi:hypothetical protein
MRDGCSAKRALQVTADTQDGALGKAGVHPHITKASFYEEAAVQV